MYGGHMRYLAAVATLLAFFTPRAAAQIVVFWQRVPITPGAIASDPALTNMQTWDLRVTTTGDWASAGLRAQLPPGLLFYNAPQGGATRPSPTTVAMFPHVEFDTYATSPADTGTSGAPNILGSFRPDGPASFGGAGAPQPGRFNLSWGDLKIGRAH